MVLWESFQPKLKAAPIKGALRGREAARKNLAGRKRWDEIAVFKGLALQALPLRRSGGISAARSPLVRVVSRPWSRRRSCRRQNFVALPRGAGQGGRGERAVRFVLEGQGRSRQGERWFQALFARKEKRKARRAPGAKGASGSGTRGVLDEDARALVFEPNSASIAGANSCAV